MHVTLVKCLWGTVPFEAGSGWSVLHANKGQVQVRGGGSTPAGFMETD